MNVWSNSIGDIYYSLNDLYMTLLMSGWMLFFMAIYYKDSIVFLVGVSLVLISFFAIRTQVFVTENQFLRGMIPHHSMAVFMSEKLKDKSNSIQPFLNKIIQTQKEEIQFMKERI